LCGRLKSTIVTKEPEELMKRLDALTEMDARDAHNGKPPAIATKKYWAGELAGFLNEILERGTAVVPNARGSSIRAAGS
jgi:hypothetical protein